MSTTPAINDKQPEFVTMRGPLTVEAAASGTDGEVPALPQFRMVAYTGGLMRIAGFPHPVVVDLAGLDIPSQNLPIRLDHERRQGVGHTHRVSVERGNLVAEGLISRDTSWARDVARSGANGFPWQASIGAAVVEAELVPGGVSVRVNVQTFTGPVHVVRRAVLKEISFVDSGADTSTTARIAAHDKENHAMSDMDVTTTATEDTAEQSIQYQSRQDQHRVEAHAKEAADASTAPAPGSGRLSDAVQAMRAEAAAESRRIAAIRLACDGKFPAVEAKAIEDGWDATRTELEVLRASRPSAPAPGAISGRSDATPKVIEAAACLATNAFSDEQLVKDYGEQTLDAAHRFRNIGVAGLIRLAAAAEGRYIPAVGASPTEILEAAASTMSLPGIMSNIANKSLIAGFDFVENAWRRIAKIGSVRDFKTVTRYRFIDGFGFDPLPPNGEIKHGQVGEESYTNKADTYAKMFGVDRRDIVNDDLDALKDVPFRIGEGAALTINKVFWTLWLANPGSFFSAGHKNYKAGADTALSVDGLTLARHTFSKQRRPSADGKHDPLGIRPKLLLVPSSLEILADLLMTSTTLNEAASSPKSDRNPHANKFSVVASDYLDNEDYSGSSAKAWYLLAEPSSIPTVEVVFLNGKQVPTVERSDMVFNKLGIEFRGYLDFGVKEQDFRGGLKMKGEA
jgi:hypothetical protein